MKNIIGLLVVLLILSCSKEVHTKLIKGHYRAELIISETETLPFTFKVTNDDIIEVYNAEEVIVVDEIKYKNDSIVIRFPVYEGYIAGKFANGKILDAQFIKESLDRVVPVVIEHDKNNRFENVQPAKQNITGIWEMTFTEDNGSTFIGKGVFNQVDGKIAGTIRTTTGDYRYLEGVMDGEIAKISVFDGAHAFLFTSSVSDSTLTNGVFYSGDHYKATFTAKKNPDFELPDENKLTYLKEGYDKIEFSFPDLNNNLVSLKDDYFKNKVTVVQIMGSWCPNCLDESKYYTSYVKENPDKEVVFVSLAFEYAKTKESAFKSLQRLKDKIGIPYPILLAQYGSEDKKKAQEKLPMLNHVLSYPTTIFIDKTGTVRKIHTGFNGPATGDKYIAFKTEFESFLDTLLQE